MGENSFVNLLNKIRNYLYTDFLGGKKIMPMRYVINFHKVLTFVWVIFLMIVYDNYSSGMYWYLFLHGSYGICWCTKQFFFPDETFKQTATIGSLLILETAVALYWVPAWIIAAGYGIQDPSNGRIILCCAMYFLGIYLMMGSDMQKNKTLVVRKGLISTGFFSRTRNPNYLGEILIYQSFVIMSGHYISEIIVLSIMIPLFTTNIYLKDELSYKKKAGWEQYSKQSYILLPKIFNNLLANICLYSIIAYGGYWLMQL